MVRFRRKNLRVAYFSERILDEVIKYPWWLKKVFILILLLLFFVLSDVLSLQPNREIKNALEKNEGQLRHQFEKLQQEASAINVHRKQIEIRSKQLEKMLQQLPLKNEIPGLLETLSNTGALSGLTLASFTPQPEVPHDFYIELPIQIVVSGTYHQFAIFVSQVAAMDRIVVINDFEIEKASVDKLTPIPQGEQLIMKMTLTLYRHRMP